MLVVCILASALGALVMCLLVLRYGFIPIPETNPARADRDLLVTRLGHAFAGVCFAASAILAVVYIARAPVQPVAATPDPRKLGQACLARLAELFPGAKVVIGIGGPCKAPDEIARSYDQAHRTTQTTRCPRHQHRLQMNPGLHPERPADIARQHTDIRRRDLKIPAHCC